MTGIEKVARAIKTELGKAMSAKPLHGDASSGDWYTDGESGCINLEDIARAAVEAIREPNEAMWGGLARDIIWWTRFSGRPTGDGLHKHLLAIRPGPVPEWLAGEIPNVDFVPPKGTVAVCIYKAMIDALLNEKPE